MLTFLNKILTWLRMNGATICGLVQTVIKTLKEIATGLINLLSIFAFTAAAEALVVKVRGFFEKLDGWIEIAKTWLLSSIPTV